MIVTKDDLKKCIKREREIYLHNRKLKSFFVNSKNYVIYKYQKYLRKEEFYGNNKGFLNKILYIWFKRKKNILGQTLGFDIPKGCFESGLEIHHVGGVTVNADARIGKNCNIAGNICIGSTAEGAPRIGNNCKLGYGCIIIGDIEIADDTTIGAGAVVTKSISEVGRILVGIPAKTI